MRPCQSTPPPHGMGAGGALWGDVVHERGPRPGHHRGITATPASPGSRSAAAPGFSCVNTARHRHLMAAEVVTPRARSSGIGGEHADLFGRCEAGRQLSASSLVPVLAAPCRPDRDCGPVLGGEEPPTCCASTATSPPPRPSRRHRRSGRHRPIAAGHPEASTGGRRSPSSAASRQRRRGERQCGTCAGSGRRSSTARTLAVRPPPGRVDAVRPPRMALL